MNRFCMKTAMLIVSALWAGTFLQACAGSSGFGAGDQRAEVGKKGRADAKKKKYSDRELTSDEDAIDEPVMVGGIYLTALPKFDQPGNSAVGVRIEDQQGNKVDATQLGMTVESQHGSYDATPLDKGEANTFVFLMQNGHISDGVLDVKLTETVRPVRGKTQLTQRASELFTPQAAFMLAAWDQGEQVLEWYNNGIFKPGVGDGAYCDGSMNPHSQVQLDTGRTIGKIADELLFGKGPEHYNLNVFDQPRPFSEVTCLKPMQGRYVNDDGRCWIFAGKRTGSNTTYIFVTNKNNFSAYTYQQIVMGGGQGINHCN